MTEERAEYLVDRYADLLLRIGRTWLGDMDDAKDICQTVLTTMKKLLRNALPMSACCQAVLKFSK